ncbi:hypothetical protein Pmani_007511 [Petrolisthes manimaculis]|uniref:Uncharacterized protein n=1 Tax=Petrolisthes manimaculis TaxID=1843537 RepID=A0AAE1Q7I9_9EUCA|nr:hypothetical protein Pmani_007511 [Petrolisthes manimaculis]
METEKEEEHGESRTSTSTKPLVTTVVTRLPCIREVGRSSLAQVREFKTVYLGVTTVLPWWGVGLAWLTFSRSVSSDTDT